jgi:hypothetical protein
VNGRIIARAAPDLSAGEIIGARVDFTTARRLETVSHTP